jgi:hypothetical protein
LALTTSLLTCHNDYIGGKEAPEIHPQSLFIMDRATTIRNFIQASGSTIISVEFVKKNGEKRKIQFNPLDRQEIVGGSPSTTNPDIIRVRDFKIARDQGQGAWRSFDVNRVLSITSNGQHFQF